MVERLGWPAAGDVVEAVGVPPPPSSVRIKDNILYANLTEVEAYDAFVLIIGIILH